MTEFFGTALLLVVVIGSGIMAENLAAGNMAVALLGNSLATGAGMAQWFSEIVATVVLLGTIRLGIKFANDKIAMLVALIVMGGYWFTASTFFSNPAVTFARSMTDTFAGIRQVDTIGFIMAQLIAAVLVVGFERQVSRKCRIGEGGN